MNKIHLCIIVFVSVLSCSKNVTTPSFIAFKVEKDSIIVIAKNEHIIPMYFGVKNIKKDSIYFVQSKKNSFIPILTLDSKRFNRAKILRDYKFTGQYGIYNLKSYDSNYNYALPFKDGYSSNLIQGYNGEFTHKGLISRYSLDFDMAIGDTITASREGVVTHVTTKHKKQGTTEAFRKYGNFIMIYHKDGTFSQYVHLKQNGNLVAIGDTVKRGQAIGLSGFTGWTTIPHLHFGVYKPGEHGLESIKIIMDSIPAENFKKGQKFTQ